MFLRVYFILGSLAILSLAQLDVHELFQVDVSTNAEGGCGYIGTAYLNIILHDCILLANAFITAIDDSTNLFSPRYIAANNLFTVFFKPITPDDRILLKGIYIFRVKRFLYY